MSAARFRCSDAQATALAFVARAAEAETLYVRYELRDPVNRLGGGPRDVCLLRERVDDDAGASWFEQIDSSPYAMRRCTGVRRGLRWESVDACIKRGWLALEYPRYFATGPRIATGGLYFRARDRQEETLHELCLTEDGTIALGLWRERKLKAPPAPMPTLTDREREIAELAQRAFELGYALCAREPARLEARRMRRAGWFSGCWVANNASGLVPTPMALVEVRPDLADSVEVAS